MLIPFTFDTVGITMKLLINKLPLMMAWTRVPSRRMSTVLSK